METSNTQEKAKPMPEQDMNHHVITYLSRLTGQTVAMDTPMCLRSVQRAAFASWARQQHLPVRLGVISSSVPFTLRDLLATDGEASTPPAILPPVSLPAPGPETASPAVGIDIEDVENMPLTHDYREHAFYRDNFTAAEIAFCIRQANVRASFCGTWAAKEAILKSGRASAPAGHLKGIEILRDDLGRPRHPGCSLSISHTAHSAVALCTAG